MAAIAPDEVAQHPFAYAVSIDIGRVDERAPRLGERIEDGAALRFVAAPPQSVPNVIAPKQSSDTRRPDPPINL